MNRRLAALPALLAWTGVACALAGSALAGEAPAFDPKDPKAIQAERRRISERYKDDLPRLAEELERLALTVAKAMGTERDMEARMKLEKKYRPTISSDVPGPGPFGRLIIDHRAWRGEMTAEGTKIVGKFRLDPARYTGATPQNLKFRLRRKSGDPQQEGVWDRGGVPTGAVATNLAYTQTEGAVFVVEFTLPENDWPEHIVQITADIEHGFATSARIPVMAPVADFPAPAAER